MLRHSGRRVADMAGQSGAALQPCDRPREPRRRSRAAGEEDKRVVGVDSGMDKMQCAVELLAAAARVYSYVQVRWEHMSEEEKKIELLRNGSPANLSEEMGRVTLHK